MMRTNPVKEALKAGRIVFGSEVSRIRSAELPRIYASAGFDFVFIDMEHTVFDLPTVADMIQTARACNIVPLVRVPQAEYAWVSRVLDAGAQGIIAPRVNTPEQVQDLISWMRYPPLGVRGFACTHYQTDDQDVEPDAFMKAVHEHSLLVIQIERQESLDNLERMLSIRGIDVACLGYMDLSVDLGMPGRLDHPQMMAAIERLIDVSDQCGVAAGIICPRMDVIARWVARGMRFISYASEALLLREASMSAVQKLRTLCENTEAPKTVETEKGS